MVVVDGIDGYLAASTQNLASAGLSPARNASRMLGILVVVFSFVLGGGELLGLDLDGIALPLGIGLFVILTGFRIWARSGPGQTPEDAFKIPTA
jgi:high-affinity nickel-transport protein